MSFDFQFQTSIILKQYMPLTGGFQPMDYGQYGKNADAKAL